MRMFSDVSGRLLRKFHFDTHFYFFLCIFGIISAQEFWKRVFLEQIYYFEKKIKNFSELSNLIFSRILKFFKNFEIIQEFSFLQAFKKFCF